MYEFGHCNYRKSGHVQALYLSDMYVVTNSSGVPETKFNITCTMNEDGSSASWSDPQICTRKYMVKSHEMDSLGALSATVRDTLLHNF